MSSNGKSKKVKSTEPASDRKRKDRGDARDSGDRWKSGRHALLRNPKRGAPGILMTCERGKEMKCQREGLEIISHYYSKVVEGDSKGDSNNDVPDSAANPNLSLEEELQQLKSAKGDDQSKPHFGMFEVGCRGVVFALCTIPGCEMIPSIKGLKNNPRVAADNADGPSSNAADETYEPVLKKMREDVFEETGNDREEQTLSKEREDPETPVNARCDPVPVVRQILQDITDDSARDAPSSRFVSRMIPIQATCFPSQEELQLVSRMLIQRYFPRTAASFGVAHKRRMCPDQFTKEIIIDTVAAEVLAVAPKIKVNLDNPDVTVVVEVCKNLCGVSVIPKCKEHFRNFNLAVARDEQTKDE